MYFSPSGIAPTFGDLVTEFLGENMNDESLYDQLELDLNVDMRRALTIDNYAASVEECYEHFHALGLKVGDDFHDHAHLRYFRPVMVMFGDLKPHFYVNELTLARSMYANSRRNQPAWNPSRGFDTLAGWLEGLKPHRKVVALTRVRVPGARYRELPN